MNFHASLIMAAVVVVIAVILSIIASFASLFGLDFSIAAKVCVSLFFVIITAFCLYKYTSLSSKVIPSALGCCFLSFRPAFDFWAYGAKNSFYYNYMMGRDTPWFANGWIQLGIALAIFALGHLFLWAVSDDV